MNLLTIIFSFAFLFNSHMERGDVFYRAFDNQHAFEEYQLAYNEAPENPIVLERMIRICNDFGRILLHRDGTAEGYYRKSIPFAEALIRRSPSDPAAHFWMALSKGSLIPYVGSKEKIQLGKEVRDRAMTALQLDSAFSYPYVILAVFEREKAKLSWMERVFARLIFGEDLSGSFSAAENYLKKAIRFDPSNAAAYYELGWTYLAMDDKARAIAAFQRVCSIPPQSLRDKIQIAETETQLRKLL